jgi:pseudouridine-5'-phosphate glycosidase
MEMNAYMDITDEVRDALETGKPVVALETTIVSHGMPYPVNVETALAVEANVRRKGGVPATIAVIGGRIKVGLTQDQIEYLATAKGVRKVSRRDLPVVIAMQKDGATTVAGTMIVAKMAGIRVFVTGGVGGVHRGAGESFDISADLEELKQTDVTVVCAGCKSLLDIPATLSLYSAPMRFLPFTALPADVRHRCAWMIPQRSPA